MLMFSEEHENNSNIARAAFPLFSPLFFCVSRKHKQCSSVNMVFQSNPRVDDPRVWDLGGMHHCRASMILPNEARCAPDKEKLDGTVMRGSWSPVASFGLT